MTSWSLRPSSSIPRICRVSRSDSPRRRCSHCVSCVDELLASITAVRRIYRLAVRAPGRRLLVSSSRAPAIEVESDARRPVVVLLWSAQLRQNDACISAASAPRRRAAKTRPAEVRREDSLPARDGSSRTAYYRKLAAALVLAQRVFPLAQGPAAGRAGASRRETPATAAHRPFAALPKHARLGASAFTRGSPISTTPSFERQASSEGARPRCDSAQRAAFAVPAAPQRCCACFF